MSVRVALILSSIAQLATGVVRLRHAGGKSAHGTSAHAAPLGDTSADGSFVRRVEIEHNLRVCNAYPLNASMDVYVDGSHRLTGDAPLPYKACRDFKASLNPGDKLDFKVGDATTGTFSISSLPNNDAIMLLVIHRHDAASTAVSFESHVYGNLASAQVAVIDTFKGKAVATPRIEDKAGTAKNARSEELRYNSVVAVNEGAYEVVLDGSNSTRKATGELVALNKECYVVMRTGLEDASGQSFPEELVIFPMSNPASLHSGAFVARAPLASLLAALLTCWFLLC